MGEELAELVRIVSSVFSEAYRDFTKWPRMEVYEDEEIVMTISDVPYPLFNNVFRRVKTLTDRTVGLIDKAKSLAKKNGVPFLWWVGDYNQEFRGCLPKYGFQHVSSCPMMKFDLGSEGPGKLSLPQGIEIVPVVDGRELEEWCEFCGKFFSFPDFAHKAFNEMHQAISLVENTKWMHLLAKIDGRIVGSASLFHGNEIGYMTNLGVLNEYRGLGVSKAISLFAVERFRERGYPFFLVLSSEMTMNSDTADFGFVPLFNLEIFIFNQPFV